MKERGWGRIVNISSAAGLTVSKTGIQAYASAKAGMIGFTRQMAHELGPAGITVNCIAPGFILSNPTTELQWQSYGPDGQQELISGIATRRLGAPADIANGVQFFVVGAIRLGDRPDHRHRRRQCFPVTGIPVTGSSNHGPVRRSHLRRDRRRLPAGAGRVRRPAERQQGRRPQTMLAAAHWLAAQLPFAGGRVEQTAGHPVVRADWAGPPGAPTILVYGHYDVQPTGSLAEWSTPPFELTVDGDIARGRGVTDDKGPVYIVLAVARAFAGQDGGPPLNVKFLFEGEEEIGSPHLAEYLTAHAAELAADLVISADGAMWRPGEPSLSIGSKGLVSMDIIVEGATADLHSGRYGGTVANPLHALSQILASLHHPGGGVAVAGFYDGIEPLTAKRRAEIARVPFDETGYLSGLGLSEAHGEPGYSTLERLWERPTLEVNGITGGGKYTVIPHRAVGHVSCRLVPGQNPDDVIDHIASHVSRQQTPGVRAVLRADDARVPAYTIAADHPAITAATAALEAVYPGQPVLLAKIGGTLPAADLFERLLARQDAVLLVLDVRRKPARAGRVPAHRPAARGHASLGAALAAAQRRAAPPRRQRRNSREHR